MRPRKENAKMALSNRFCQKKLQAVIKKLKNSDNNAISFVYENATFGSGPLSNTIVTIKDLYATNDAPTMASSKFLENFNPGYEATVVKKLKAAGAAIVAKTHMDELALGGTGEHSAWGIINNPLDSSRMPGGSSSGAVAAFDEDITIALGSDTGDSVRLPAAYCGLVGFKPSYGAVSRYGMFAFASSLDTVGWFTHDVATAILASQVLYDKDYKDHTSKAIDKPENIMLKPQKIAFLNMHGKLSKDLDQAYKQLQKKLTQVGIIVEIVTIDENLLMQIDTIYEIIAYSEMSSNDANLSAINFGNRDGGNSWEEIMIKARSHFLGKMVQRRFTLGAFYLLKENQQEIFERAQKVRRILQNVYKKIFEKYDLLMAPTSTVAPKWDEGKVQNWTSEYSTISNLIGSPSITLPFAYEQNMPLGIMLDSKIYDDKRLLSYALYLEKIINFKSNLFAFKQGANHE